MYPDPEALEILVPEGKGEVEFTPALTLENDSTRIVVEGEFGATDWYSIQAAVPIYFSKPHLLNVSLENTFVLYFDDEKRLIINGMLDFAIPLRTGSPFELEPSVTLTKGFNWLFLLGSAGTAIEISDGDLEAVIIFSGGPYAQTGRFTFGIPVSGEFESGNFDFTVALESDIRIADFFSILLLPSYAIDKEKWLIYAGLKLES